MKLTAAFLDLLYPHKCPFCQQVLEPEDGGLCARCQKELPWVEEKTRGQRIEFCREALAPLWYRDRAAEGVRRYKFRGGRIHARLFGMLLAQCVRDRGDGSAQLVTWVPLSRKRLAERGYDQARLLAERAAELLELSAVGTLEKLRDTPAQSGLRDESARRANARGAYRVTDSAAVAGKHILLVDDVATSGATLSECAGCLMRAGAASVTALTLTRAGN